jgi:glycosyltransferase involved in cell wall biosynthesis
VRFTFLSTCPEPWGGSEELWWEAACALRGEGQGVDVLKTSLDEGHPRIRRLLEIGCRVGRLDGGPASRSISIAQALLPARLRLGRRRSQMAVAAAALIARRPDLAIVCQGRNMDGAHLGLVCGWLRIPYVVISQKATEAQWPADDTRRYVRRSFQLARRAVFVSRHNHRLTEQQIAARIDRAVVVRNPVRVTRDGPLPWPETNGLVRVACIGRLFPAEKGQDILLNVLAREHWRERPLHVSFYGDGVNRKGLEWLARDLGVERVSFEGFSGDVEGVWGSHHVLVLPSRAEGLPLTLVEAMSCGRVAVVTDVGGNAEVVDDGATGFVAESPTVAAFDRALERAWAVRADWPAIGEAAARAIAELVPDDPARPLVRMLLDEARR